MNTPLTVPALAYRRFRTDTQYVSHLPGENGVDWGYSGGQYAKVLSPYWQRRLAKYARDCRFEVGFVPAEAPHA